MTVTGTTSGDTTTSLIDLELSGFTEDIADQAKQMVGEFLVEQVLIYVADSRSPVSGEKWPSLSKKYAVQKERLGSVPKANMELFGDMLNALKFEKTDEGIEIGFWGDQAPKADGHLNFSGESKLAELGKQRRFLPAEGQTFRPEITKEVEKIIADAATQTADIQSEDLKQIEDSTDLYKYLEEKLGLTSEKKILKAIARNPQLFKLLSDEDLIGLL